ncbi:hypothetical protein WJX82_008936 [Trebouxia sp. C0006]
MDFISRNLKCKWKGGRDSGLQTANSKKGLKVDLSLAGQAWSSVLTHDWCRKLKSQSLTASSVTPLRLFMPDSFQ